MPIRLFYNWYRNLLRNPKYRVWIILGTLIYLLSPLDLSPDLIPILGQIDDVAVLMLLVTEVFQMLNDWINPQSLEETEATPKVGRQHSTASVKQTIDVKATPIE